jgi:hypothetical protein
MWKKCISLIFIILYYPGHTPADTSVFFQIAFPPGAKLGITRHFLFPFMQGNSPLTEDNNIDISFTGEISPVSLNGFFTAVWTPTAFFKLITENRIGTGWNIKLFDGDIYGIGINRDMGGKAGHDGRSFDGVIWKTALGGTLQFDLAAIFPGEWNHIMALTYHEINYSGYTCAQPGEAWYFENDDGENVNGFNYYGNFLIGHQMPSVLNLAALLTEAELYLYDTPNRSNWGDDRIRWKFSGILKFNQ